MRKNSLRKIKHMLAGCNRFDTRGHESESKMEAFDAKTEPICLVSIHWVLINLGYHPIMSDWYEQPAKGYVDMGDDRER